MTFDHAAAVFDWRILALSIALPSEAAVPVIRTQVVLNTQHAE